MKCAAGFCHHYPSDPIDQTACAAGASSGTRSRKALPAGDEPGNPANNHESPADHSNPLVSHILNDMGEFVSVIMPGLTAIASPSKPSGPSTTVPGAEDNADLVRKGEDTGASTTATCTRNGGTQRTTRKQRPASPSIDVGLAQHCTQPPAGGDRAAGALPGSLDDDTRSPDEAQIEGMDEWFKGEINAGVQGAVSTAQWLLGSVDSVWDGMWGSASALKDS